MIFHDVQETIRPDYSSKLCNIVKAEPLLDGICFIICCFEANHEFFFDFCDVYTFLTATHPRLLEIGWPINCMCRCIYE